MITNAVKRLLLVDDDRVFTEVMTRAFARRDFEVKTSHNAIAALKDCSAWQPTHILLDLNMPGTSGLAILAELLAASPGASLVVLTGYSSIATAVEATKSGANNYLCKPATTEEILRAFDPDNQPQANTGVPAAPISVDRLEWEHIQKTLQNNQGNISATARALNMHRRTLQRKLQKRPVRR